MGLVSSLARAEIQEPMKSMKATRRGILALAAGATFSAWPASAEAPSQPDEAPAGSNQADFDQVWELVRDRFYDPHLNGLDWQEQRARFRPDAASARSREDAAVAINAMLAKLGASHTHFYTPEDPAYYQLADIFVGALEHRGLDRRAQHDRADRTHRIPCGAAGGDFQAAQAGSVAPAGECGPGIRQAAILRRSAQ